MTSERHKHSAKNLSASISSKTRDISDVGIPMRPIEKGSKVGFYKQKEIFLFIEKCNFYCWFLI